MLQDDGMDQVWTAFRRRFEAPVDDHLPCWARRRGSFILSYGWSSRIDFIPLGFVIGFSAVTRIERVHASGGAIVVHPRHSRLVHPPPRFATRAAEEDMPAAPARQCQQRGHKASAHAPVFTPPRAPFPSQTVAERAAAASRMQQQQWQRVAPHEQPTEAEAATAARAAAAAMAAAKVQVLGTPWQGGGRRRPSDHRAAAAAAAALAGLGGGQWGGANAPLQQQQQQQGYNPQQMYPPPPAGQNGSPASASAPAGAPGAAPAPASGGPAPAPGAAPAAGKPGAAKFRTPAEKMMAAAAVMNASVAEAIEAANAAATAAVNGSGSGNSSTAGQIQHSESTVDVGSVTSTPTSEYPTSAMSSTAAGTPMPYVATPPAAAAPALRFEPPVRQWQVRICLSVCPHAAFG